MTPTDWQTIMHRAAFLSERVAGGFQRIDKSARFVNSDPLWTRWCDLLGGEAQLAERLGWLGLDVAQAQALLQDGQVAAWLEPAQQPPWAAILAEALTQSAPVAEDETAVIAPFLTVADPLAEPHLAWLSPAVQQNLRDYLAARLRDWVTPTVQQMGAYNLPTLCATLPVLGRQLATTVLHWVDEVRDFHGRVAADWSELTDLPLTADAITAVQPNLSDPHHGGRTVWHVQLADGQTLAYKPKSIALDHAWQQLVRWLNARGLTPSLTPLWTLPRANYGWMAWAEAAPLPPTDPLYDLRTGILLGLFHLLHATDLHSENLIHGGAHPQLVDGEMLVYPQIAGQNDPLDVLRTGALPMWFINQGGVAEVGGLTQAQPADIGAGYARLMAFATEHEAALWAEDGPLAPFRQGMVRFVPRPTAAYGRLLDHLRHPAFLVSGAAFSVELDSLARAYLSTPEQRQLSSLLAAEQAAVSQGDVPFFTTPIGQPDLHHSHGTTVDFFVWPPIRLPSPAEQAQQQAVIQATLTRGSYLPADAPRDFLGMARVLGELVAKQAVPVAGDGLGWMAFRPEAKGVYHQHALVGEDFYAGRAGIALFLAALWRVTGEQRWRELALAGLRGGKVERDENTAVSLDPGGRLYALALLADWLDAPHLIEEALALANQAHKLDSAEVIDGQAGLLLGLLKLRQVVGDTAVQAQLLAQAVTLGEGLLANWQKDPHRLGGFSHGAAGIAYALTQLYQASGEARFAADAEAAWAFQQTLFDAQEDRWQDRRGAEPVCLDNWCHGSAGVGLAGAAMGERGGTAVEIARNHLCQAYEYTLDTLCCGRCGQIDVLWELGERATAREMAEELVAESVARGAFQLYDDVPAHLFNPTFFRGVAGIGYTLLRMVYPLPCVLRMG